MIIKFIHHSGKKRQTSVEKTPSFTELRAIAVKIWGQSVANCLFGYTDDEDDLITISDQDDWNVCIEEFSSKQDDKKLAKIVINILEEEENFENLGQSDITQLTSNQVEMEQEVSTEEIITPNIVEAITPSIQEDKQIIEDSLLCQALRMSMENVPDQLDEWKMVSNIQSTSVHMELENGEENIFEEAPQGSNMEEEESVFQDTTNPVRVVNTNPEDQLIEINIDGNDLEAVRQQIMHLAPMMGFEIESAEIVKNSQEEKFDELDQSNAESFRSSMTNDMRDEIKRMVQEQVQEELRRSTLASLNASQVLTASVVEPEVKEDDTVHIGFSCDICGVNPIKGVRFHSMIQRNFDLCAKCEKTNHTEHPMIRFRKNTHRGLAHGKDWNKLNKIMLRNETQARTSIGSGPSNPHHARGLDVIKFFTNGIANGFGQMNANGNCPFRRENRWSTCGQPNDTQTQAETTVQQPTQETTQTEAPRTRPGLCHIRSRVQTTESTPTPVARHARFEEFRKVFTTANPEQLNAFLNQNAGLKNENELYNLACTMFLNYATSRRPSGDDHC